MKLIMKTSALLMFALAMVAVTSCNKYEEGSNFSLLSAKARIVNNWKVVKVTFENSGFTTTSTPDIKIAIKKDNTYTTTYTSGSTSYSESGTWAFNSDKTQVIFTDADNDSMTSTIVKLKNKELTLENVDGSTTTTVEYIQE
jgi:hypothetical protein